MLASNSVAVRVALPPGSDDGSFLVLPANPRKIEAGPQAGYLVQGNEVPVVHKRGAGKPLDAGVRLLSSPQNDWDRVVSLAIGRYGGACEVSLYQTRDCF